MNAGVKVIGGISEEDDDDIDFGIFVKNVLPGGVADLDGIFHVTHVLIAQTVV